VNHSRVGRRYPNETNGVCVPFAGWAGIPYFLKPTESSLPGGSDTLLLGFWVLGAGGRWSSRAGRPPGSYFWDFLV
jgi:hypothetical protein